MTDELRAVSKKRTSPDAATPSGCAQEGDHRKRRRNRTTLSCLNCHISKRMCDRKRPCGRCTQLGLTGLCIYEVGDPSERCDARDEGLRLRQRVAELESVIREMKNKPHPRWAKSQSSPGEGSEKHCSFSFSGSGTTFRDISRDRDSQHCLDQPQYSPPTANSNVDGNKKSCEAEAPSSMIGAVQTYYQSFLPPTDLEILSTLSSSPPSDPLTQSFNMVAKNEYPQFLVEMASDQQLASDIDLASLFMTCSDLLICDEGPGHTGGMPQTTPHSQHIGHYPKKCSHDHLLDGHCGCLNETVSYNVMLELSLRLRKAAGILSHSANHRFNMGMGCPLNQRIAELDTYATTILGNITTSPNDTEPVYLRSRANTTGLISPTFFTNDLAPTSIAASHEDDSFMSWEPLRRV